jgi:hypothetical protein
MKINKKFIILFILMVGIFVAISTSAQIDAIEGHLKAAAEEGAGYSSPQDPRTTAAVIIRTALGIVGTVFIILMIYAGALWMTSGGNEEKVSKAKKIITTSVIGLIIVILSYGITRFVIYVVTGGAPAEQVKTQPPQEQFIPFQ